MHFSDSLLKILEGMAFLVFIIVILYEILNRKVLPVKKLAENSHKEVAKKFSQYNSHKHTYYATIRFFDNTAMLVIPLPDGFKSSVMEKCLKDFIDSLEKALHDYIIKEELCFDKIKREIVMKIRAKDSFFIEVGKKKSRFTIGLNILIL